MSGDTVRTFEEYVAATGIQPRIGECRVCVLDPAVKVELGKFYEAGYRSVPMRAYLASIGIEISASSLANHMTRGHSW